MTIYYVGSDYWTTSLKVAKAEMKRTGLRGQKVKVYSNGDWVLCGDIELKGNNKCHVVGEHNCNSY